MIIQLRRGTAAEWAAANPILAEGEPGLETDTMLEKRGDGVTPWNSLDYLNRGPQGIPGNLTPEFDIALDTAEASATLAGQHKTDAQSAASAASTSATAAQGSASAAATSATQAASAAGYYSKDETLSKGSQLILNGTGALGTTKNFPLMDLVTTDLPVGAISAFSTTALAALREVEEFVPVDPNKVYRYSYMIKQLEAINDSYHYGILNCYDIDKLRISPDHVMYQAGTTTTLAAPLSPGDTTVNLTSTPDAAWTTARDAGAGLPHIRSLIFWNYTNSRGYTFPVHTYSRNKWSDLWAPGGVNTATGVITLKTPWAGPAIPAGTSVSAGSSGGTYKYVGSEYAVVPREWTAFFGEIGGVDRSGNWITNRFPPGTAYVKASWLFNRTIGGSGYAGSRQAVALASLNEVTTSPEIDWVTTSGNVLVVSRESVVKYIVTGSTSLQFTTPPAGVKRELTIIVQQDATGGRAVSFGGALYFKEGNRPTPSYAAGSIDVYRATFMFNRWLIEQIARDIKTEGVASSGPQYFVGSGSPEGVIVARPGSVYIDRDQTLGAVEWTKWTGTGFTGWTVTKGNTGRRVVTSLLNPLATATVVELKRIGNVVTLSIQDLKASSGTAQVDNVAILDGTLPLGFRPASVQYGRSYANFGAYVSGPNVRIAAIRPGNTNVGSGDYWGISYLAEETWPSSLPGTPG